METTVTKTGTDYLKDQARKIARASNRRFPDVLAELRRAPRSTPQASKELVLICPGLAHPLDPGRCARPAGHHGTWSWCASEPHLASHIWEAYHQARSDAERAQHEVWLASLTPEQRAEREAEAEDNYWAQMAADAAEPYDPYEDKYRFLDDDEGDAVGDPGPYADYGDEDEYGDEEWDGYYG